jgi:hypothetical protein
MLYATLSRTGRSAGLSSPFDALMYGGQGNSGHTRETKNHMSKLSWKLLTKKRGSSTRPCFSVQENV